MAKAMNSSIESVFKNAEAQFVNVVHSSKQINQKWMLLPTRYNSRLKIYLYFRKYWSKAIAKRMLCNLRTKKIKGKLYIPAGDPGIFPNEVNSISTFKGKDCCTMYKVKYGWQGSPGWLTVNYQIKKDEETGRFVINYRNSGARDYRYAKCIKLP